MRNSHSTKETLLSVAGELFNTHGYKATSISDITKKSGFTKGAIYRHFRDKDALEKAAFQFLINKLIGTLKIEIRNASTAPKKLQAILEFYKNYDSYPPIPGGCPLLNASVEVDDTNPELRSIARETLKILQETIIHIIQKGIQFGQFKSDVNAPLFSNLFIAAIEGSVMMSKLQPGQQYLSQTVDYLNQMILDMTKSK